MRTSRHALSLLLVFLLAGAGVTGLTVLKARPKLGLDLSGGLSVVLTAHGRTRSDVLDKTVEVIRQRVDALGAQEPDISRAGDRNIIVQLPQIRDPKRALEVIGKTAQLRFREVLESLPAEQAKQRGWKLTDGDPVSQEVIFAAPPKKGDTWYRLGPAEVVGSHIRDAYPRFDQTNGQWTVQLEMTSEGARKFAEVTRRLAPQHRQLAIVLDRLVESAPQVQQEITDGRAQITGAFTEREVNDLALVLRAGALPVELELSQTQVVSPTLGRAALRAGLLAGLIGLALVAVYMLALYRLLGVVTLVGMGLFAALVLGLIGLIGAVRGFTLTLAGIAGLIVSVGIAADSYIVYFERVKDELKEGKTFRSAVDRGFASAIRTNVAANLVAFFAAIILYLLAVGSVRGFALTLGISALFDIFILNFYTHPAVALIARNRRLAGLRAVGMREVVAPA